MYASQYSDHVHIDHRSTMKKTFLTFFAIAIAALTSTATVATAAPEAATVMVADSNTHTPNINKREVRQRHRIKDGVKDGELTKGEAAKLVKGEKQIQADKKQAKSDGTVTKQERLKLQKEENQESRKINRMKHNDRTSTK